MLRAARSAEFQWLGLGQGGPACEGRPLQDGRDPNFQKEKSTESEVWWALDAAVIPKEF